MKLAQPALRLPGRPRQAIDPVVVGSLAELGYSNREIAGKLGCHTKTLHRRFASVLAAARTRTTAKAKLQAFRLAEQGDRRAVLFLLKCRARWKG